jgi:polyisoprenoid-binding protein YceI
LSGKKHLFAFEKFSGRFSRENVEFRVDARAMVVKDDWAPASGARDKIMEVAQKEMLETAKYPDLVFLSSQVKETSPSAFEVTGQLTIKNVTKPVVVQVKQDGEFYSGTAILKHTDFGLKQQEAVLGAIGTKNEMVVRFRLRPGKTP